MNSFVFKKKKSFVLKMSFRFNFENSEKLDDTIADKISSSTAIHDYQMKSDLCTCKYISANDLNPEVSEEKLEKLETKSQEIVYLTQNLVSSDSVNISLLDQLNSDLLPGQYEGGLKVWECSIDLVHFLAENNCINPKSSVLELGCGVGLPGLFSYKCGAFVTFQDYNSEVLELITIPNVVLNSNSGSQENINKQCQFLSGDWNTIHEKFYLNEKEKKLYDVILTSETIYNKSNQKKLLALMKAALKQDGVIYLASKVYYFGVGGGVTDFEDLLREDDTFEFSTVFKTTEGVERQILKLTYKNQVRTT